MSDMTETQLMHEVYALCDLYSLMYFHSTDARLDRGKGFPDLVIVGLYRLAFAELKTDFGQMSHEQTAWRYRLGAADQTYYLWRPSDLLSGNIEAALRQL